ncbi:MAG: four helix bundle protein [Planctomycetaceae bacterium]
MRSAECGIMGADRDDLRWRTKEFALRVIRLVNSLPNTPAARTIGGQLIRAGTSVGSNYRAACRARSSAEFRAKLGIVEEEADESMFWIELLIDAEIMKAELLQDLLDEANSITAMVVSSIWTSRNSSAKTTANRKPR